MARMSLARLSSTHSLAWTSVWALSHKELQGLQAHPPSISADVYAFGHGGKGDVLELMLELVADVLVVGRVKAMLEGVLSLREGGELHEVRCPLCR